MLRKARGYLRTVGQYWQDTKGNYDIKDYGKAILIICATAGIVYYLVK